MLFSAFGGGGGGAGAGAVVLPKNPNIFNRIINYCVKWFSFIFYIRIIYIMASLTSVSQPQTASAVPVPLASSARMVLPSDQGQVLTAAAAPHIPSSSGESKSKLSPDKQKALNEMERKVANLGKSRGDLLKIRKYLLRPHPRGNAPRKLIKELTSLGTKSKHEKLNTYSKIIRAIPLLRVHDIPTPKVDEMANAHANIIKAMSELREHHEAMMKIHPGLFKKEGQRRNRHRVYFPHGEGEGATKVSLWEYDGQKKNEKKTNSKIHHKIFHRMHEEDFPTARGTIDPRQVPPINGGRKTRKHRRKHKRKTRKHKRKRKTKKRKHHRRKHKRKTRRR